MSKKPIILIDGNNMAHRAIYKFNFASHKGKSTSLMFGVPYIIKSLVIELRPKKVIVVWDGKRNPNRLNINPDYKRGKSRKKKKSTFDYKEFSRQQRATMAILKSLGIAQVHSEYQEADDYIYELSKVYKKSNLVIVSSDKDFHQMIDGRIHQYSDRLGKGTFGVNELREKEGLTPAQYLDYMILRGDDSDNIPGYFGIGDKKAKTLLEKFGSIPNFLISDEGIHNIDKGKLNLLYQKNSAMMDLEFFSNKWNKDLEIEWYKGKKKPKINRDKFLRLCNKYGLNTMNKNRFITHFEKIKK